MTGRVALLLLPLWLVACGADRTRPGCLDAVAPPSDGRYVQSLQREGASLRVIYAGGREVVVPSPPARIVSTLPGITETVAALGGLASLVGITEHCDHPPEVAPVRRLSVQPLDRETLTVLRPDLVLADSVVGVDGIESLGSDGPAVLTIESRSLGHVEATMYLLAEVLATDAARQAAARFRAELERARREVASSEEVPARVLLLAQSDPLFVLGPGSLLDDMLRACGCVNVACDLGRASGPFSEELALARRPDWILSLDGPPEARLLDRWSSLAAVREGRVAEGAADDLLRAGPRSVGALLRLSAVLRGHQPVKTLGATR